MEPNELSQEVTGEHPPLPTETSAPAEAPPVEVPPVEAPPVDEPPVVDADTLKAEVDALEEKKKKAEEEAKRWAKLKREQRDEYFREKKKADQVKPEESTAAPKEEDFDTTEAYEDAVNDWKIERAVDKKAAAARASRQAENLGEFVDNLIFEGREKYSDFNDIGQGNANPITKQTLEILQDFEHPADIVYYLGKNLQESVAISRMPPTAAARKLSQIEATVAAELKNNPPATTSTTNPTKTVTTAPAPIIPSGSGGAPITKDPAKMSQPEYEDWRTKGGGR